MNIQLSQYQANMELDCYLFDLYWKRIAKYHTLQLIHTVDTLLLKYGYLSWCPRCFPLTNTFPKRSNEYKLSFILGKHSLNFILTNVLLKDKWGKRYQIVFITNFVMNHKKLTMVAWQFCKQAPADFSDS